MRILAALSATAGCLLFLATPFKASAADPKACDALPPQTAAALAGGPVGSAMDVGAMCAYVLKSGGSVGLVFQPIQPGDEAKSVQVQQSAAGPGVTTETVSGLAGPAVLIMRPGNMNVLAAGYHAKVVLLSVPGKMTPALKSAMIQAMKQALAKL